MATVWKRSKKDQSFKKKARRQGALGRLEIKLKEVAKDDPYGPLHSARMAKEIVTLKTRLGLPV